MEPRDVEYLIDNRDKINFAHRFWLWARAIGGLTLLAALWLVLEQACVGGR